MADAYRLFERSLRHRIVEELGKDPTEWKLYRKHRWARRSQQIARAFETTAKLAVTICGLGAVPLTLGCQK